MHSDWCGKPCADCQMPCALDEAIPCSPDCECLGADGEMESPECETCDANPGCNYQVHVSYDGILSVCARSEEEAREKAAQMTMFDFLAHSGGTWSIDEAETED